MKKTKSTAKKTTIKKDPRSGTIASGSSKDQKTEINLLYQIIEIIGTATTIDDMLTHVAKALSETLKSDSCLVYLLENNNRLILSSAWPPHPAQLKNIVLKLGEGITGWVALNKKPVALERNAFSDQRFKVFSNLDEDRYMALLSVPIVMKESVVGVINLQNKRPHQYSLNQIRLVSSIATQLAHAFEKIRLIQSTAKKTKQLETIVHLSKTIVSSAYLQEILQLIVTLTAQLMNSKICSLMLYDEKTQELKIEATQSLSDEYRKKAPLKVGQSVSGKALQLKQPVMVRDVTCEAGYNYPAIAKREGLKSMLSVPMVIKDKLIGVINCYTTYEYTFSEEEISVLQTIASQSAVAIENTRLFEDSQSSREALETRKFIERAKGMLMRERNMKEQEAFQYIQRQAMNLRRSMREIAEALLLSEGLKKTEGAN